MELLVLANQFGEKGLSYLTKANWKNANIYSYVNFKRGESRGGNRRCGWLRRGNWKQLANIGLRKYIVNIANNCIKEKGCEHLSKLESRKMESFYMYGLDAFGIVQYTKKF